MISEQQMHLPPAYKYYLNSIYSYTSSIPNNLLGVCDLGFSGFWNLDLKILINTNGVCLFWDLSRVRFNFM